jgi:hypothetical protein
LVLGEGVFRAYLRARYYTQLCEALLSQAATRLDAGEYVPDQVRSVAGLGQLANPIISFNIEPLPSLLLARPAGPVRLAFRQPEGKPAYTWREPGPAAPVGQGEEEKAPAPPPQQPAWVPALASSREPPVSWGENLNDRKLVLRLRPAGDVLAADRALGAAPWSRSRAASPTSGPGLRKETVVRI